MNDTADTEPRDEELEERCVCDDCGELRHPDDMTEIDGIGLVCPVCLSEYAKCVDCGEWAKIEDMITTTCGRVCLECAENYATCERCGVVVPWDDVVDVHGVGYVCEECAECHYWQCDDCCEWFCSDNVRRDGDTVLCDDCFRQGEYGTCDDCGAIARQYDLIGRGDGWYCEACAENHDAPDGIHDYGYRPTPIFHNHKHDAKYPLYMGFELEVECKGDSDDAPDVRDMSDDEDLFYLKHDGSLDNGFELVTHPGTLEYYRNTFPLKRMTGYLARNGCRSHDVDTCGLHVHISRRYLSPVEQSKLSVFVNRQRERMEVLARRSSARWSKYKDIPKTKLHDQAENNSSRYEALNFQNRSTIEFRMFKGTLNHHTILATLELVQACTEFIKTMPSPVLFDVERSWNEFLRYISNDKRFKELRKYMHDRNEKIGKLTGKLVA